MTIPSSPGNFKEPTPVYSYLEAAEHNCNDTPARLPIFSGLSPQQRVHIVKEVMVGLLCENEPLPQKEEHLAASLGIWQTIKTELI
jgi:hypothetical protein